MTYSFAVLRAALRPDGCAARRAAIIGAPPSVTDENAARFDALLRTADRASSQAGSRAPAMPASAEV